MYITIKTEQLPTGRYEAAMVSGDVQPVDPAEFDIRAEADTMSDAFRAVADQIDAQVRFE